MKKHLFFTASLLLAGAASLASCSADEESQDIASKKSNTIEASYAALGLPGTRVSSEGDIPTNQLAWSDADAIGVLVNSQNAKFTLSSGTKFTGSVSMAETDAVKGYYPYDASVQGTATSVSLSIPTAQTQSAANIFNGTDQFPMVADASTQSAGLQFKALAGIFRFKIYNTGDDKGEVNSITVTPASGAKFSGTVTYSYDNNTADNSAMTADAVTLTMTNPIAPAASADADAQCAYMIAADEATLAGSTINIRTTKGSYTLDLSKVTNSDTYIVRAGKIRTMLVNLSNSNVTTAPVPTITSVSNDMPVNGTPVTVKGTNLNLTKSVKVGTKTYTDFTVNNDGTELTLTVSSDNDESSLATAGGKITLLTEDGTETSSATMLDSNYLIADFNTCGTQSWGSHYYVNNTTATSENAPTSSAYFVGIESGEEYASHANNVDNEGNSLEWSFGLMVTGTNRMVGTETIPAKTSLSDIEIAFEYYTLDDLPDGTSVTVKYPDANSVTVSMADLTKLTWHTCAITLDKFAKANDVESTKDNYVNFTSTTYGNFYGILSANYTNKDYAMAFTFNLPDNTTPLNVYVTNVRLRLKTTEATPTSTEINATINALADADNNTINDFK